MTVYLGSQNVGVGMVEMIPADVKNEDIIITENGVYNAGEGYTGLGTVTVDVEGSGNGSIIEVVNKTGLPINEGDKVWLNENVVTGGTNFTLNDTTSTSYLSIIHPTGISATSNNDLYLLKDNTSINTETIGGRYTYPRYNGSYVYGFNGVSSSSTSYVFTPNKVIEIGSRYRYIENSNGLFVKYRGSTIERRDINTGELLQSWEGPQYSVDNNGAYYQYDENTLIIRGYVYTLQSDGTYINGTDGTQTQVNGLSTDNNMYLTKDNKHLISLTSSKGLSVYRIIDATNAELLPETDLPEDLKKDLVSGYDNLVYNYNNDIMTIVKNNSATKEFMVIKHNNGKLEKLPFTLPFVGEEDGVTVGSTIYKYITDQMTFTDDMSRAMINLKSSTATSSMKQVIINFDSTSGYVAMPYRTYAVDKNTITGVAQSQSQPNELTQVMMGSVANQDLTITENGTYIADTGYTGLGTVTVEIDTVNNQDKTITENGTYIPDEGYTGFGSVTVNIETKPSEENVGDEIEVINNTGTTINVGDKVWVNSIVGNTDGSLAKTGYYLQQCAMGFTKDSQYLFTGGRLNKVNKDNTLTELRNYNTNNDCRIKQFNGKTYAISLQFTACINYPNNWDIDWTLINDGYFVHAQNSSIRKYDLETGALIKEYTGNADQYDDGEMIVIDNIMYRLNYKKRKYVFNDDDNTYSYYDYAATVNGGSVGHILGRTADGKYFIDDNLSLIKYLGNDTFEVVAYEKMPAILQRWNGINKKVQFNQDTGVLVVDEIESSGINEGRYGIYKYDNGEWYKINFELNRTVDDRMVGDLAIDYDLTKYAFLTSNLNSYRVNVGTMQPNLKLMAQEFKWFNIDGQSITGIAKTSAEPGQELTVSTILEPKIDVSVTTNADNVDIIME